MQYTLVGHVSKDLVPSAPEGFLWGGTVTYGGRVVAQLGADVSILTCAEKQFDLNAIDSRLTWHVSVSPATTTFINNYDDFGHRHQMCLARADSISLQDFPDIQPVPDIIHLAPVMDEIPLAEVEAFAQKYPDSWLVATPQGWMRRITDDQKVERINWEYAEAMLPYLKAVVFSNEDIQHQDELAKTYAQYGIPVLYTRGADGAILFQGNEKVVINAIPSQVVDPTGAGDMIGGAFFVHYFETGDPVEAAIWGTAAASIGIEHMGATGLPSRQAIEARLNQWDASQRFG